ncbi:MAG: hypothetical protein KC505_03300 [Myxococcales bacterium]|nr:hypothetical protein [Myxococcales bacterium]USN49793.1 MAG: hypothetical protein H6731_05790 [Myxococcales bacterium]
MKSFLFAFISLFALNGQTQTAILSPIASFPSGHYLGLGHYVTADNQHGNYSSYLKVGEENWQISYLREYGNESYEIEFMFDDNASFIASLVQYSSDGGIYFYMGAGYCHSNQCHLSIDMDDRFFEETLSFYPEQKKIFRIGSISRKQDSGNQLSMSWQENLISVDMGEE